MQSKHDSDYCKLILKVLARIFTPEIADEIITSGQADAVTLGRPLLRDPEFPKKAAEGRSGEISECISYYGCMELAMQGKRVHCVQVKS